MRRCCCSLEPCAVWNSGLLEVSYLAPTFPPACGVSPSDPDLDHLLMRVSRGAVPGTPPECGGELNFQFGYLLAHVGGGRFERLSAGARCDVTIAFVEKVVAGSLTTWRYRVLEAYYEWAGSLSARIVWNGSQYEYDGAYADCPYCDVAWGLGGCARVFPVGDLATKTFTMTGSGFYTGFRCSACLNGSAAATIVASSIVYDGYVVGGVWNSPGGALASGVGINHSIPGIAALGGVGTGAATPTIQCNWGGGLIVANSILGDHCESKGWRDPRDPFVGEAFNPVSTEFFITGVPGSFSDPACGAAGTVSITE